MTVLSASSIGSGVGSFGLQRLQNEEKAKVGWRSSVLRVNSLELESGSVY